MKKITFSVVVALLSLLAVSEPAAAQTNSVTVSPAIEQLTLVQGQQEASFTVSVTNARPSPIDIEVSAEDFTYLDQNGAIRFTDPSVAGSVNDHGLASQMVIAHPIVAIGAGATQQIPVKITAANTLAEGGHYAAVLYHVIDPSQPTVANIGVRPVVATLVFVSTEGKGTQTLRASSVDAGGLQLSLPPQVHLVLRNDGNTQATPRGLVQIYGPGNHLVQQGIVNIDSALILPGSSRLFTVAMPPQANGPLLPGNYRLVVLFRHDGQMQYDSYTADFWVVPGVVVALTVATALVGIILLVWRLTPARYYRSKTVQK